VSIRHCDAAERLDGIGFSNKILPLRLHNAILQVWLELGGVGIALGFSPLILLIWRAFRMPAWNSRLAHGMIARSFVAAVSVALASFRTWQEWFVRGFPSAAAFMVLVARQSATASESAILSKAGVMQA
jgi:O-antigen ligase